jgi:hypothetical protein
MQLFALALIATVLPLSNSDGQPANKVTAEPVAPQLVCRAQYHEGMVIRRGICHTPAEWDMTVERNEQDFRKFQQRAGF